MTVYEKVPAHLWDGKNRIRGHLTLTSEELIFELQEFAKSHLQMKVPLTGITRVEPFLIFSHIRKGLKIISDDGREDLFVLEDPLRFRNMMFRILDRKND